MLDEQTGDPSQLVAELRRQRDEALEQQRAIAEALRVAETSLRAAEERHALVIQAVAEGIYDWNIADNRLWVSHRLIELFGWEDAGAGAGERPSQEWNARVHPEDFETYRAALRAALKGETPRLSCEYRIRLGGDEFRWVEDHAVPVRDESGWAVRLVGAVSDVTERKERERELQEALDQQTATAEVLQVINSSPGNLAPVFDAMLEKVLRLCEASYGMLWTYDGEHFHVAARRNIPPALQEFLSQPIKPGPGTSVERVIGGASIVHTADVRQEAAYREGHPRRRAMVELGGARAGLTVALRQDGKLLGVFVAYRQEVRPFTGKQIALLQSFAAQAVVAMENARLLNELRDRTRDLQEALEYQTAISDVLKVISQSKFDLQPVLDTLVVTAAGLCVADQAVVFRRDADDAYALAANFGFPPAYEEHHRALGPIPAALHAGSPAVVSRAASERRVIHIDDVAAIPGYPEASVTLGKQRTTLGVPLLREGEPIGVLALARQQVEPFTERQIELVRTFAAQAVIAMENARLLNELRDRTRDLQESLEYQTSISEVLQVISRSTFDLDAVLKTVVNAAARLCGADHAGLYRDQEGEYCWAAGYNQSLEYERIERNVRIAPGPGTLVGRTAQQARPVQLSDAQTDPLYEPKQDARAGQVHSMLGVPLLREGSPIGVIGLARTRIEPFTPSQVQLVSTFADQAVIAIENARLLNELRDRTRDLQEALEYQTAISDVLKVISRSTFDLELVLETLAETAARLCDAEMVFLFRPEGEGFRGVAGFGFSPEFTAYYKENIIPAGRGTLTGRVALEKKTVHIIDSAADPEYTLTHAITLGMIRTQLGVPLLREGSLVGTINLCRQRVEPFSERQIELVRTFADQAVIAIENARLLNEIRQRQAELRVTFDNMGDGVAMFDGEMRLVAWNMNFQQILELPDDFLAQRPTFADYFRYMAARGEYQSDQLEAEIGRYIEDPGHETRFERTRPDGRVIEVRRNRVPGGGFVLIIGDITERKHAEAEIRAARDAAEQALSDLKAAQASLLHAQKMSALGQLTAGIAHEIKNPLNFVNNFSALSNELLVELKEMAAPALETLDDDSRADIDETIDMLSGNLEKIAGHGKRADNIVKSMLAHSRGSSGERTRTDLNALVDEALNLAYHGARAHDQNFNITMERDFDKSLAPIELVPQDMMRVFINLIGNGFHAAHKRRQETGDTGFRPVLRVATRNLGNAVEVRVRDNGTGIRPEHRDKLFQPFFTTKPTGEGTGLGLSISYDIVTQQHGGTITVESEPDMFTEFTVYLPRADGTATGRAA